MDNSKKDSWLADEQATSEVPTTQEKARLTVVIRRTPYGSSLARAAVDAALANAAFEQPVDLLFIGDGILQLLAEQNSRVIGVKNIGRLLGSAPLYDIEAVYVDAAALARYQLTAPDLMLPVIPLDEAAIHELLCASNHLLAC